jgi:UDP-N-acetyl-2-amino-2-deoxyglucuronate dehydrogenase
MQIMNFAIIGVGNIASIHAAAIRGTPDAELVAVATRNPERGKAFVAENGGTWYGDFREVLKRPDIDVVTLCTPHDLHAPMTIEAAAAGKHVLCEKPMARTVAECDGMIVACERAGVMLGIVFQGRFEPLSKKLKADLEAGRLGKLLWTSSNTVWYRNDEYYRSAVWRGTWAHEGGGVLINQAIHAIDMLLWVSGMPTRVTAQMRTLNHQIDVEDAALAMLEYPNGGLGLVQATTDAFPGYAERLEFYGTNGGVVYHKSQGKLEWHIVEPRQDVEDQAEAISGAGGPMTTNAAPHTALYQDFAAAIRENRSPLVDGREGRRSLEVVEAVYQSARSGAAVALPLQQPKG